jgi:hypothetical protein
MEGEWTDWTLEGQGNGPEKSQSSDIALKA